MTSMEYHKIVFILPRFVNLVYVLDFSVLYAIFLSNNENLFSTVHDSTWCTCVLAEFVDK